MNSTRPQPRTALALAGGGPLGAIYEIGTLMALSEALDGFDFNELDVYVGVSAGSFIAAGLANGLSPAYMYRMFVDSQSAELPFEPEMLLKPAFGEYARRGSKVPGLLFDALCEYLRSPLRDPVPQAGGGFPAGHLPVETVRCRPCGLGHLTGAGH